MKVDDIRIAAQLTSGLQISDVVGLKWVVDAIQDICTNYPNAGARKIDTATITDIAADYAIQSTLLKLIDVKDASTGESVSDNNTIYILNDDNTITFKATGSYTVEYLAMPVLPTNVNDAVPLPPLFITGIQYYLAHKMRGRLFGQNDANAVSFLQQYQADTAKGELARQRQGKKRRIPAGRY